MAEQVIEQQGSSLENSTDIATPTAQELEEMVYGNEAELATQHDVYDIAATAVGALLEDNPFVSAQSGDTTYTMPSGDE